MISWSLEVLLRAAESFQIGLEKLQGNFFKASMHLGAEALDPILSWWRISSLKVGMAPRSCVSCRNCTDG